MINLKKLLRYAIGLLAVALLFNISGYVYISRQSKENDRQEENEKIAGNLQTLSQQVAKDMLLLLIDETHHHRQRIGLRDELDKTLHDFEKKQSFLRREIDRLTGQTSENLQGLNTLFTRITPYYDHLVAQGEQLLQDTAITAGPAEEELSTQIRYNESQYHEGMQDITRIYRNVDDGFVSKIFFVNTGILTSLIFAIIAMAVFVIVPVIKEGDKNYRELKSSLRKVKQSGTALRKRDNQLQALGAATHQLIGNGDFVKAMKDAIGLLGAQMDTDRISIYKDSRTEETGAWSASRLVYWTKNGMDLYPAGIDHFAPASIADIIGSLQNNEIFTSSADNIVSPELREWLLRTQTQSIVVAPIFVMNELWGHLGLSNCRPDGQWTAADYTILRSFAASLGSAIERAMMEEQLVKAKDAAEAGNRARNEFMANISHELRTPMNGIIGFSDLLLTNGLENTQRQYVQNVSKSAYSLLSIINDILDFSKIEAGKFFLENTDFDLGQLVEDAIDMLSIKAYEKKLELIADIDPGIPSRLWGDPARIRQILVNLLGNAIKFTGQGEVDVIVRSSGTITENEGKKYTELSVAVKDTGIGIPAEKIDRIFDRFTQADSSTTRKYGGTGLGLTISRSLAEMMGGRLTAESQSGNGSLFTLHLTLEIAAGQPVDLPLTRTPLKKVLVVDDNFTNCQLMQGIFNYFHISCDISHDGPGALIRIDTALREQQGYDLIITDHQMPIMDGISLVRHIKDRLDEKAEPFILMLSSVDQAQYQLQAKEAGIDKFLAKPVKLRELSAIITSIFSQEELHKGPSPLSGKFEQFPTGTTVLIVEDEPVNMLLISEVLRKMNIEILRAGNGQEALDILAGTNPQIIFMDINMPEMDGYTATRLIRQSPPPHNRIPVIALTADATPDDRQRCLDAGMDNFISKPFRMAEIGLVLKKYLC
jgi:signal transduction histidine kinase/CheY-like chemotaxis protein